MRIYDVTRNINRHATTYPKYPSPEINIIKNIVDDEENVQSINLCLQSGTHVVSPARLYSDSNKINNFHLSTFFGASVLLDFSAKEQCITYDDLYSKDDLIKENTILLIKTKNSFDVSSEFSHDYISFEDEVFQYLISKNLKSIGVDGFSFNKYNLPQTNEKEFLRNNIVLYKNLYFNGVPEGLYMFYGFPLKVDNAEASPVRAVLLEG